MLIQTESCAACRFDSTAYTNEDVAGTLRAIGPWWRLLTLRVDSQALSQRPSPNTWSAVEYAHHTAAVTQLLSSALAMQLQTNDLDFGPEPAPEPVAIEPMTTAVDGILDNIETAIDGLLAQLAAATTSTHIATFGGNQYPTSWIVRHACHDALHHLQDVGRGLHALGAGAQHHRGSVAQIHQGNGGVPKFPVASAIVGYRGIKGDTQRSRVHHGRVWQALCLYSGEAISRLRSEGHSIAAGSAGENLTITGIDWAVLRPNTRMLIGDHLLVELTMPALPCKKNAQWFADGNFMRMHHVEHPQETRWYARVLHDGEVRANDAVVIEP